MDLLESCRRSIEERLKSIENKDSNGQDVEFASQEPAGQTQAMAEAFFTDKDKDINKILHRQVFLKRTIDADNHIQLLKSSILKTTMEIDDLRKACVKVTNDGLKGKREMSCSHAKDLEKYQMAQLRSIAEDHNRHRDILEKRKTEIQTLKKEIEREQKGREAYLLDVEKKLNQQIQERQKTINGGGLPFTAGLGIFETEDNDEQTQAENIQLTSVDEYAPYGTAPHSRATANSGTSGARGGRGRGRGAGRGRGRRSKS